MLVLLALHLAMAITTPALARWLGSRTFLVAGLAPLAVVAWATTRAPAVLDGTPIVEDWRWVPELGLELGFRLDGFALLMVTLVAGIGCLIFLYSRWYFSDGPGLGRLAGTLVGFAGAMLGVVVADNLLVLFVFWELTSITSYLLIGHDDDDDERARAAALQALLTTGVGGLAMLAGFVLLAQQAGTYSLVEILADPPTGTAVDVALALVLLGAFAKSAQVPFQSWLPGAMVAPTPVSAYLHSATMVTAGVYLIARLAPAFAGLGWWRPVVVAVGLTTMAVGAWSALRQNDLKLLLAYGTISQLGFMTVLVGVGYEIATLAGVALLLVHGVFKAGLFMVTGIVEHATGTRDLRRLSGVGRALRSLFVVAAVCAASMAGIPPLMGFVTKELAFDGLVSSPLGGWGIAVIAGVVAASALTVAYSARYLWGAFATKGSPDTGIVRSNVPRLEVGFVVPAAVLALVTVALGVAPALAESLVVGAAEALDEGSAGEHLALWHGLNAAAVLSAVTITIGIGLWVARRPVARLQQRLGSPPEAGTGYRLAVRTLVVGADRVTGIVQSGSLPVYLSVILLTALLVPGVPLLAGGSFPRGLSLVDRPVQAVVAAVVVIATLATVRSTHRLAAVLAVGATGYGIALLFVLQGAPDLALTQLLIETLMLVLFVLVLRHLPKQFRPVPWRVAQLPRVAIAIAVGVFVAGFSLVAASSRIDDPVSVAHLERAYPDAHGRNVVNVILVDFRAFDTLGEIVVLTTATLGIIGLVRATRRERGQRPDVTTPTPTDEPYRHSPVLDVAARLLVPTVAVFALFLLVGGHNRPGGGFIAGLVAGSALVLRHVSGYPLSPRGGAWAPEVLLGSGVAVAVTTGMAAWPTGGAFLESGTAMLSIPGVGEVDAVSAQAFDVGVFLVVVGLVLGILRSVGREQVRGR